MMRWLTELLKDHDRANVVLGWGLGAVTGFGGWAAVAWGSQCSKRRREVARLNAVKRAVAIELEELSQRMIVQVWYGAERDGKVDRQFIEWVRPLFAKYRGPNPSKGILAGLDEYLQCNDSELAALAAHEKATHIGKHPLKEEAPYCTSAVTQAHDFEPDYSRRLLDILAHLRIFEGLRENAVYYHRLTFDSSLTPENHQGANQNADTSHRDLGTRARRIVEKIEEFQKLYNKDRGV